MSQFNLQDLAGQIIGAAQAIADRVKEVDAEIAELNRRRSVLERSPMPKADYLDLVRQQIRRAGETYQYFLRKEFSKVDNSIHAARRGSLPVDIFTAGRGNGEAINQIALCYFFEDQLVDGVAKCLDDKQFASGPDALSLVEIEGGIGKVQIQIDALLAERDELIAALKCYHITE
ncbi:MAG: hypothetical protein NFW04_05265 [Candidatus Accumulibacter sp.]|uniref:hypothetical protein n=1 Tax=Accumulibacter sp. TaxID=2053492 RepID=UPI0025CB958C|nr:hypothetical protein [Accumulibacter sp.]MCM8598050.1 hypothetical protein [Accumulibacter sp.]